MQDFKELFYTSFGLTLGAGLGLTLTAVVFTLLDKVI